MSDSVKKRAASEEADGDPSKKKTKLDPEVNEVDEVAKPPKKPFNPLSPLPTLDRPASHLFVFGNGDSGQFGLGTDVTGDISRPRLHNWMEDAIKEGKLGGEGCGLQRACAGGMHTLALDESGKVYSSSAFVKY